MGSRLTLAHNNAGLLSHEWQLSLSGGTLKQQLFLLRNGVGWPHSTFRLQLQLSVQPEHSFGRTLAGKGDRYVIRTVSKGQHALQHVGAC